MNKLTKKLNRNDEDILFFAFRYALGRRTGAVGIVVDKLIEDWDKLRSQTQKQIKDEIGGYHEKWGSLGDDCDIKEWSRILDLK
jgi:hypothetical protein|tara:strand:+ start:628 stop:879 length:252 start_codon:yes stop_codon:yes gene_type:complete